MPSDRHRTSFLLAVGVWRYLLSVRYVEATEGIIRLLQNLIPATERDIDLRSS